MDDLRRFGLERFRRDFPRQQSRADEAEPNGQPFASAWPLLRQVADGEAAPEDAAPLSSSGVTATSSVFAESAFVERETRPVLAPAAGAAKSLNTRPDRQYPSAGHSRQARPNPLAFMGHYRDAQSTLPGTPLKPLLRAIAETAEQSGSGDGPACR